MFPPIGDCLPHSKEAVLLDAVEHLGPVTLTASCTVRANGRFSLPDGSLASWAAPEIMAQAVSAFANLTRNRGNPPSIGLLLGIRDFRAAAESLPVGTNLRVEVTESSQNEDGSGVFICRISHGDDVVAEGKLTVLQPQDPWATLADQIS